MLLEGELKEGVLPGTPSFGTYRTRDCHSYARVLATGQGWTRVARRQKGHDGGGCGVTQRGDVGSEAPQEFVVRRFFLT